MEMELAMALPTMASLFPMPIQQEIMSRMLMTTTFPLGEDGYNGGGRGFGFGHGDAAVLFPASAAAVAGLEKRKFVAGGRDDDGRGGGGASGCSICLQEFQDGEEVSVMPCSRAHEFHQNCITKWLGMKNTCPLCRHGLPTGVGDDGQ